MLGYARLISFLNTRFRRLTQRDGCGRCPIHVAVVMNGALTAMELLYIGTPTQTHDIYGLTPAVSTRNSVLFYADHIDRTPADQWVISSASAPWSPTTPPTPAPSPRARRYARHHLGAPERLVRLDQRRLALLGLPHRQVPDDGPDRRLLRVRDAPLHCVVLLSVERTDDSFDVMCGSTVLSLTALVWFSSLLGLPLSLRDTVMASSNGLKPNKRSTELMSPRSFCESLSLLLI